MNKETESSTLRSVVVTEASRGIGEAVTKAFLVQGDRVAGISHSGEAPNGVLVLAANATDPDALAAALAATIEVHGFIEALAASAGINRESLTARTSSRMWDEAISAGLTGTFSTVRVVMSAMVRARRRRIVLVSLIIAARGGMGLSTYGVIKGGVEGLTCSLTYELAPWGITINAVAPGLITTAMTASLPDHIRITYLKQIPLGRFAGVTDIAGPVPFLASSAAAYVTDAILGVDGGLGMGR